MPQSPPRCVHLSSVKFRDPIPLSAAELCGPSPRGRPRHCPRRPRARVPTSWSILGDPLRNCISSVFRTGCTVGCTSRFDIHKMCTLRRKVKLEAQAAACHLSRLPTPQQQLCARGSTESAIRTLPIYCMHHTSIATVGLVCGLATSVSRAPRARFDSSGPIIGRASPRISLRAGVDVSSPADGINLECFATNAINTSCFFYFRTPFESSLTILP